MKSMVLTLVIGLLWIVPSLQAIQKDRSRSIERIEPLDLICGEWVLVRDRKLMIVIKRDSMIHLYDGKVTDRNACRVLIDDSLKRYETRLNTYEFLERTGEVYPGIRLQEFGGSSSDTIESVVIYLDRQGMDLRTGIRGGSFLRATKRAK